jgi:hypothetical protein
MNNSNQRSNGWGEYEKLVLNELERLNKWSESFAKHVDEELTKTKVEIATLKVKAAMWGALAAAVAGPIVAIIANILIKG